ncbi:MAG: hypothetical protein AMJ81_09670 [Phycisphaerae bacterium SM23_33]|nr:MAG: hypothetical protein AMJ81_09670 [Phycisphaerae bacterium SM23_33]
MVLALAAAVIAMGTSQTLESLELARDYQQAAELLDRLLTKIDLIGPERLLREGPLQGQFDPPEHRFTWAASLRQRAEGHLYEVTVRVSWPVRGGRRSAEAQSLLNDPPGTRSPDLKWNDL